MTDTFPRIEGHTSGEWHLSGYHRGKILAKTDTGYRFPVVVGEVEYLTSWKQGDPPKGSHATYDGNHANAALLALAPTAPHYCGDPECPGELNARKLAAFDALLEAVRDAETCIEIMGSLNAEELATLKTLRAAIARCERRGE